MELCVYMTFDPTHDMLSSYLYYMYMYMLCVPVWTLPTHPGSIPAITDYRLGWSSLAKQA